MVTREEAEQCHAYRAEVLYPEHVLESPGRFVKVQVSGPTSQSF